MNNFWNRPSTWLTAVAVAGGLYLAWLFWHWEIERVEIPPNKVLVRINLFGKAVEDGVVVIPESLGDKAHDYKGIEEEVVTPGRVFLNPIFHRYEIYDAIEVPKDRCLVRTRRYGKEIPAERAAAGDVLARDGERGVVKGWLGPGTHFINPYAYDVQQVPAVEVKATQVGVRTLKVGKDPRELRPDANDRRYVVPDGYRGVQAKPVTNGSYYLNPFEESIVPVEVSSSRVEFADIEFPSKDGFILRPHVLLSYRIEPGRAPELFVQLVEKEGVLHQQHETVAQQEKNELLQKIILPLVRGYARIEGSKFDARDFLAMANAPAAPGAVAVNAREKLQNEMKKTITERCAKVGIVVESVSLAQLDPQGELKALAEQIADREQARIEREKYLQKIAEYKTEQELKAAEALAPQRKAVVEANTKLKQATTLAKQQKEVEEARLKQSLENAQTRLDAARKEAEKLLAEGKAEADVINAKNEAEVAGLRRAVEGFSSPDHFAQYHVIAKLAPALKEIFASDGSDFAKLFSSFMAPSPRVAADGGNGNGKNTKTGD